LKRATVQSGKKIFAVVTAARTSKFKLLHSEEGIY